MKKLVKRSFVYGKKQYQNWQQRKTTHKNLNDMLKNSESKSVLTTSEKQEVLDYYKQFGFKVNTDTHNLYKAIRNLFDVRYIPEDFYGSYILPKFNDKRYLKAYTDKNLLERLLPEAKQSKTLLHIMSSKLYDSNYHAASIEYVEEILTNKDKVILKPATDSNQGRGIKIYRKEQFEELLKDLSVISGDYILQEFIQQDEFLTQLNETSVNIFRVTSYRLNNEIKISGIYLVIGNAGNEISNFTTNSMGVKIEFDGRVAENGYDKFGVPFNFSEKYGVQEAKIKQIEQLIRFVKEQHGQLPYFDIVGWDLTIDSDGQIVMIEANLNFPGVILSQYICGPLFGDDTEEILSNLKKK